jgi:hypothetical protein
VFVRDFLYVDKPYDVLSPRFETRSTRLTEVMTSALNDLLSLAPGEGVSCELGGPRPRRDGVALPLRWTAPGGGVPSIDGEVALTRFDPRSELALDGSYHRDSALPERVVQRRVEECVRGVLHALAAELEEPALRSPHRS